MADDFDPYYQWLGISPKQQPPHHYRLLGVELFEIDPDVISCAADQRMAHVRTFQIGPHAAESQRVLNELAAVRRCLLNPQEKQIYDAGLRAQLLARRDAAAKQQKESASHQMPLGDGDRWAQDIADDVKAASKFAARQAERLKIMRFRLPQAYRELGAEVYSGGKFTDEFAEFWGPISAAEGRLAALRSPKPGGGIASKVGNRARTEAAERKLATALADLGRAAYARHGAASGSPAAVGAVETLERRVAELDEQLHSLESSRSGRLIGPKWLAAAGATIVALIVLSMLGETLRSLFVCVLLAIGCYAAWRFFRRK